MSIGKVVAICTIVSIVSGIVGAVAVYVIRGNVCASENKTDIGVLQNDVRSIQKEQSDMAGDIGLIQRDIEYISAAISNIEQQLTGVRRRTRHDKTAERQESKKTMVDSRKDMGYSFADDWSNLPY